MIEYKEIKTIGHLPIDELNRLGEADWELINVRRMSEGKSYLFKKKVESPDNSVSVSSLIHYLSLLTGRSRGLYHFEIYPDGSGGFYQGNREIIEFNTIEKLEEILNG